MTSPFLVTSCYAQHSKINTRFKKRIIALLVSTAITAPTLGGELPGGATVAAGNVSIGGNGNAMTVTQQSNTAIVNWRVFSCCGG